MPTSPSLQRTGFIVALCALAYASACSSAVSQQRRVTPTRGEHFVAELERVDAAGDVIFNTDAGQRTLPMGELVAWGKLQDTSAGTQVLLADGSVIVASDVQIDGETLVVESKLFGEPKQFSVAGTSRFPIRTVKSIVFRVPVNSSERDALFARIRNATGNQDQLWLANGDVLPGNVSRLEREETQQRRVAPLTVGINTSSGLVEVRPEQPQGRLLEKVEALVFNPLLVQSVPEGAARVLVGFVDGSRLYVERLEPKGDQVEFLLASGVRLTSHPDEEIWRQIASLQPFDGNITYLSKLTPRNYRHTPLFNRTWPLGVDENVLGGRLRTEDGLYIRGLGMHSRSRVVFVLPRRYRRFEAELAVDASAGGQGSVQFVVATVVDGKVVQLDTSPIIRGGDAPVPMSVDISGRSNVVLFVVEADRGTQLDRANWLNARLVK